MSPIEARYRPTGVWIALGFAVFTFLVLIFVLDRLTLGLWIVAVPTIIFLVFQVDRAQSSEPLVVINEEGVFDSRLRMGVISWADIRRIRSITFAKALHFISLDLHNKRTYQSRRPLWLRAWSQARRVYGLTPIMITTNGLDVDHDMLIQRLHEGCMEAALKRSTIEPGSVRQ